MHFQAATTIVGNNNNNTFVYTYSGQHLHLTFIDIFAFLLIVLICISISILSVLASFLFSFHFVVVVRKLVVRVCVCASNTLAIFIKFYCINYLIYDFLLFLFYDSNFAFHLSLAHKTDNTHTYRYTCVCLYDYCAPQLALFVVVFLIR